MFPKKPKQHQSNAPSVDERNSLFAQLSTKSEGPGLRRPDKVTGEYFGEKAGERQPEMDLRAKLNQQRYSGQFLFKSVTLNFLTFRGSLETYRGSVEETPLMSGNNYPELLYSCPAKLVTFQVSIPSPPPSPPSPPFFLSSSPPLFLSSSVPIIQCFHLYLSFAHY